MPGCAYTHAALSVHAELSGAGLDDDFAIQLASARMELTEINLSNNQISDAGLAALCCALHPGASAADTTRLSLAYNCITENGAAELARALHAGATLQHLSLEGNHISAEGAQAIAQAVQRSKLVGVHMSYNSTGVSQLACWAPALQSPWLEVLEVAQLASRAEMVRALRRQHCWELP